MGKAGRRFTGLLATALLLFAQLAVSAHACPMWEAAAGAPAAVSAQPMPCEEMAGAGGNICQKHCEGSEQAQGTHAPAIAFAPAFTVVLAPAVGAVPGITPRPEPSLFRATSPPPAIRYCRFRI